MLSIGGLNPSTVDFLVAQNETDPFWEGIKVFDMTALEWTNSYNASSAPYVPSGAISDYYAGELKYPSWSLPEVEDLFVKRPPNEPNPPPTSPRKGLTPDQKDTVIGTVVGVGTCLLCLACLIFIMIRRRRERGRRSERDPRSEEAKRRLPAELGSDQRQVPEGVLEADSDFRAAAEAGPGEPRALELATGQQIPQEVHAIELRNLFELENPRGSSERLDRASTLFDLGRRHPGGNVSGSVRGRSELESSNRHRDADAADGRK